MNILITGASGFLGQTVIKKILEDNTLKESNIYAFTLPEDKFLKDLQNFSHNPKFKILFGNICNYTEIESTIKNKDIVVHCAGFISYWKKDYQKLIEVNVKGTENVVNSCIKNNIKKLIHISFSWEKLRIH